MNRPNWDEYFMGIAHLVAKRSTCLRRQVGAVLVKDNQILATGYNGSPSNTIHCEEIGCIRSAKDVPSGERAELCRGLHAEQNVIIQAAKHGGGGIRGAILYCTTFPCIVCTKMIINSGIECIVYSEFYNDALSLEMLGRSNITLKFMPIEKEN